MLRKAENLNVLREYKLIQDKMDDPWLSSMYDTLIKGTEDEEEINKIIEKYQILKRKKKRSFTKLCIIIAVAVFMLWLVSYLVVVGTIPRGLNIVAGVIFGIAVEYGLTTYRAARDYLNEMMDGKDREFDLMVRKAYEKRKKGN